MNFVHACACEHVCAHICHRAPPPTHLHGLVQVLSGCSEAVEGEVLNTHVDPFTSRGHHTKSPPLHLTDVIASTYIDNLNGHA